MIPLQLLLAFALASVLLFLTPGPGMTLVLATTAAHGTRAGILTIIGNAAGLALMLAIVLAGLQTIVTSFESWFPWVRAVGAVYLIWLGIRQLQRAAHGHAGSGAGLGDAARSSRGFLLSGFGVAIVNPAIIAFLGAFLPQFIDPVQPAGPQFLVLAVVFLTAELLLGSAIVLLADRASRLLFGRNAVVIDWLAGGVLVLGGLLLGLR